MKYRVAMRVVSKGGKQFISAEDGIMLTQGTEAWLIISATTSYAAVGTDFPGSRYKEVCDSLLDAATPPSSQLPFSILNLITPPIENFMTAFL